MLNIKKYAAIDIGSNAIRLLVSNVITERDGKEPTFTKSALVRVPIRLGADTFNQKNISEESKNRMIKAMEAFKLLMEVHGVQKYKACATSAMREAKNGVAVVEEIFEKKNKFKKSLFINSRFDKNLFFSFNQVQEILELNNDDFQNTLIYLFDLNILF